MALLDSVYPELEVPQRKATLAEVPATILALHPDQVVVETPKKLVKVLAQALLQEPQQLQALLQEGLQADEQLQVAHQLVYCRLLYHALHATV